MSILETFNKITTEEFRNQLFVDKPDAFRVGNVMEFTPNVGVKMLELRKDRTDFGVVVTKEFDFELLSFLPTIRQDIHSERTWKLVKAVAKEQNLVGLSIGYDLTTVNTHYIPWLYYTIDNSIIQPGLKVREILRLLNKYEYRPSFDIPGLEDQLALFGPDSDMVSCAYVPRGKKSHVRIAVTPVSDMNKLSSILAGLEVKWFDSQMIALSAWADWYQVMWDVDGDTVDVEFWIRRDSPHSKLQELWSICPDTPKLLKADGWADYDPTKEVQKWVSHLKVRLNKGIDRPKPFNHKLYLSFE